MPAPAWLPLACTALDLTFGDPAVLPHPVRLIGDALDALEKRAPAASAARRLYGGLCLAGLVLICGLTGHYLPQLPLLGTFIAVYLGFAGLALGCLLREAAKAEKLIKAGKLPEARAAVGLLVSRDTKTSSAVSLRRALAETVSENFCDGFVAPLFYLALGGPGLLWAYKSVSTADSMWGYTTERFKDLGLVPARSDDVLAFVPARLAALFLLAAGRLCGLTCAAPLGEIRRQAKLMASPNAGWPMAAAAWLCNASMGGVTIYHGREIKKPRLGPEGRIWDELALARLKLLVIVAGVLCAVAFQGAAFFLARLL